MTRFYVLPMVGDGFTSATAYRAKYLRELGPYGAWRYGQEPTFLAVIDLSDAQHLVLSANPDAITIPAPLSEQVSGADRALLVPRLEGVSLAAEWLTTSHTRRDLVLALYRQFMFLQSEERRAGRQRLFTGGITLDTRWGDLPLARRQQFEAAAADEGVDLTGLPLAITLRQVLTTIASQSMRMEV